MIRVPIPFLFGTIIVLNVLQGSLFTKMTQPAKGVLNAIASAVMGSVLSLIYSSLAPVVTGATQSGRWHRPCWRSPSRS